MENSINKIAYGVNLCWNWQLQGASYYKTKKTRFYCTIALCISTAKQVLMKMLKLFKFCSDQKCQKRRFPYFLILILYTSNIFQQTEFTLLSSLTCSLADTGLWFLQCTYLDFLFQYSNVFPDPGFRGTFLQITKLRNILCDFLHKLQKMHLCLQNKLTLSFNSQYIGF